MVSRPWQPETYCPGVASRPGDTLTPPPTRRGAACYSSGGGGSASGIAIRPAGHMLRREVTVPRAHPPFLQIAGARPPVRLDINLVAPTELEHRRPMGLSPQVRGNLRRTVVGTSAVGSIPAGTGEPGSTSTASPTSQVYPRRCGGTHHMDLSAACPYGLSPQVRGNRRPSPERPTGAFERALAGH